MGVEYDGNAYNGWQKQNVGIGIQTIVEQSISEVANSKTEIVCAGRTDAGVHARGQIIHYDTDAKRTNYEWQTGVNSHLPDDININFAKEVTEDFHARFSATNRTYQYFIYNSRNRSSLLRNRFWWIRDTLDESLMQEGAKLLVGEHDFNSFRASSCQASSPIRTIKTLDIQRNDQFLIISIKANAFLQKMARNIVGSLVHIGLGEKTNDWLIDVLEARDRKRAGITAPSHGLYLIEVDYPKNYEIPKIDNRDIFMHMV